MQILEPDSGFWHTDGGKYLIKFSCMLYFIILQNIARNYEKEFWSFVIIQSDY